MTLTATTSPSAAARPDTTAEGRTSTPGVDFRVQTEAQIDAQFLQLEERRAAANRAAISRQNAATARAVAHSFSERARIFREIAATRGSEIDHAVDEQIAAFCEAQADEYRQQQIDFTASADRYGSL